MHRFVYCILCIHGPVEDFAEAFPARAVRRPHVSVRNIHMYGECPDLVDVLTLVNGPPDHYSVTGVVRQ